MYIWPTHYIVFQWIVERIHLYLVYLALCGDKSRQSQNIVTLVQNAVIPVLIIQVVL